MALDQSGLEYAGGTGTEEEEGAAWCDLERVTLDSSEESYESFEECARFWSPGESFSFLVRNIRAKQKAVDMGQLLAQLDPQGAIRDELQSRPEKPVRMEDYEVVDAEYDDDDNIVDD